LNSNQIAGIKTWITEGAKNNWSEFRFSSFHPKSW
jgi:hypothetical protein